MVLREQQITDTVITTIRPMWQAIIRGGPPDKPVYLYTYRETRGAKHITELTEGFKGYLQSDGYAGYEAAVKGRKEIIHAGCMVMQDASFMRLPGCQRKQEAIKFIKKLYMIEDKLRDEGLDEKGFLKAAQGTSCSCIGKV